MSARWRISAFDGAAFAICGDTLLHWTPEGYGVREPRPHRIAVDVLTPPAILAVLSAGYEPSCSEPLRRA